MLPASAFGLWLRNVPCHDPCLAAVKPYAVYSSDAAGERIEGMCVCVVVFDACDGGFGVGWSGGRV